jgi:hypothetical protein
MAAYGFSRRGEQTRRLQELNRQPTGLMNRREPKRRLEGPDLSPGLLNRLEAKRRLEGIDLSPGFLNRLELKKRLEETDQPP